MRWKETVWKSAVAALSFLFLSVIHFKCFTEWSSYASTFIIGSSHCRPYAVESSFALPPFFLVPLPRETAWPVCVDRPFPLLLQEVVVRVHLLTAAAFGRGARKRGSHLFSLVVCISTHRRKKHIHRQIFFAPLEPGGEPYAQRHGFLSAGRPLAIWCPWSSPWVDRSHA